MARLYESPTIESVGGDDWNQPTSARSVLYLFNEFILFVYYAKVATAIKPELMLVKF